MFIFLQKNKRLILFITIVFLLLAAGLTLFHHHAEADHLADCAVCHFVQQLAYAVVLAIVIFIAGLDKSAQYFCLNPSFLIPLRVTLTRQNRAPPFSI